MIFTLENLETFVIVTTGLASLILFLIAVVIAVFSFLGIRLVKKAIRQEADENVKKALSGSDMLPFLRKEFLDEIIENVVREEMKKQMKEGMKIYPEGQEMYPHIEENEENEENTEN